MNNAWVFIKYKLQHLFVWMLLFALWYYFRYQDYPSQALAAKITFLKVADLALMVYITNYVLIPRFLYRKKYVLFAFTFMVLVFGSSLGKMYLEGQMMHSPQTFAIFDGLCQSSTQTWRDGERKSRGGIEFSKIADQSAFFIQLTKCSLFFN